MGNNYKEYLRGYIDANKNIVNMLRKHKKRQNPTEYNAICVYNFLIILVNDIIKELEEEYNDEQ